MIVIPARLNSSRFANKVLVDVLGLPMVIRTAYAVKNLDDVVIATDSQEVLNLAKYHNIKAVMTSKNHQSGTDRINEAANILGLSDEELIVNVQADEPFIEPEIINQVITQTKLEATYSDFTMVSCCKEISAELADDANHVKVILDNQDYALYFSRSKIPYHRDHYNNTPYYGHLGIYSFTKLSLNTFCKYPQSDLEKIEKLEQLRALSNGHKIKMLKVSSRSFGIDTQEDLDQAIKIFG